MSNNTNTNVGKNNSVLGSWALSSAANDTSCNSAFGTNSLLKHTTGSFNTSLGAGAMTFNITGNRNVAVGSSALEQNAKSENNTAIGTQALFGQRDGSNNTAIGINAGLNDVSGSFNTYLGANTGPDSSLNTYTKSTAIGYGAKISSNKQIVIGTTEERVDIPGNLWVNGTQITGSGGGGGGGDVTRLYSDIYTNTYVGTNTKLLDGIGYQSISKSTAIGYGANLTLTNQIVLGTSAEFVCIPSNKGLSIGKTTAPENGIGLDVSGSLIVSGSYLSDVTGSIKIGTRSLISNTAGGAFNVAVGTNSLYLNTNGSYNVAVGVQSLNSNDSGGTNVAVGNKSLYSSTNGYYNVAVGGYSMYKNTTGHTNTAVGNYSLSTNTTSENNVAIGYEAGKSKDMSGNNTFVGANADISGNATNIQNSTALGYNAKVDVSNQIVLGTSGEFVCIPSNRGLSIGKTTAPANGIGLDVSGSFAINTGLMSYNKDLYNVSLFSNGFYDNVNYPGYNVNNGTANIAIGGLSLNSYNNVNNGLTSNIAIGGQSMMNTTNGLYNVSIGGQSMMNNKAGIFNTSVGTESMKNQIDGSYNTAIGQGSMENGIRNNYNTSIGAQTGRNDVSGSYNTYLGVYSGTDTSLNIYKYSTAIGSQATIDASNQIVLGTSQEFVCIPSYNGLSIGKTTEPLCRGLDISGSLIVSDEYRSDVCGNTKIGTLSLSQPIHGINNVAVGFLSLNNNTNGDYNVAVGVESLRLNYSGDGNVALGYESLLKNTTSGNNVAIGYEAGSSKDMSGNNTFVGSNADISGNATNIQNSTAIGSNAKIDASNQIVLGTSNERVDIPGKLFVKNIEITSSGGGGTSTGANSDASNNTLLGTNTERSNASISIVNSTAIGYNAKVDASNQIVLGTSGEFVCIPSSRGLSIGKTPPPANGIGLDVSGSIIVSGNITTGKNTKIGLDSGNNCSSLGVNIKYVGSGYDSSYNPPSNSNYPPFNNDYLCEISGNNLVIKNLSVDARTIWGLLLTSTKPLPYSKSTPGGGFQNILIGDINSTSSNINVIYTLKHTGIEVANRIEFISDDNLCLYIIIGTGNILNSLSTLTINFNNSIDNINVYMFASRARVSISDSYLSTLKLNYTSTDNLKIFNQSNTQRETPQLVWSYNIGSNNNTFVGSKSDFLSNIQINNSTSLGYNAKIDESNQIVLGTSGEFVCIPSNKGLSIGKTTAPTSGFALDISGSIKVSGDININGAYLCDTNYSLKLGSKSSIPNDSHDIDTPTPGLANVSVGYGSLRANTTGTNNTATGCESLKYNRTGKNNTAIGVRSQTQNQTGWYNTAIGTESLYDNTDGSFNVAIGFRAGFRAGPNDADVRSNKNTFIGVYADVATDETYLVNSTAIGANAKISLSNQIVLGDTSITQLKCQVGISSLSDRRDKKDIEELDTGIDFIEKVKPVKFNWNMRDGGKVDVPEWGFIAQDLIEIGGKQVPNLIDDSNEDKYCVGQMAMFPVLVKAVQDLKKIVDAQAKEIAELKLNQPLEKVGPKL